MFVQAGMHERPAVLVLVAPRQRRVEIVTGEHARGAHHDGATTEAVATMTRSFQAGDLAGGLLAGIEHLADAAGLGDLPPGQEDLPNSSTGDPCYGPVSCAIGSDLVLPSPPVLVTSRSWPGAAVSTPRKLGARRRP